MSDSKIFTPMTDRTTKLLLLAIAVGLWLNGLSPLLHPQGVAAQGNTDRVLADIQNDFHRITIGECENRKICN